MLSLACYCVSDTMSYLLNYICVLPTLNSLLSVSVKHFVMCWSGRKFICEVCQYLEFGGSSVKFIVRVITSPF